MAESPITSVAEPHNFDVVQAPDLVDTKPTFSNREKVT
jgi:hypothetical protein